MSTPSHWFKYPPTEHDLPCPICEILAAKEQMNVEDYRLAHLIADKVNEVVKQEQLDVKE